MSDHLQRLCDHYEWCITERDKCQAFSAEYDYFDGLAQATLDIISQTEGGLAYFRQNVN